MNIVDLLNRAKVAFDALPKDKVQRILDVHHSGTSKKDDEEELVLRKNSKSKIYALRDSSADKSYATEIFVKPEDAESQNRIKGQILASAIAKEENIFGVNMVHAADIDQGILVREDEHGLEFQDLSEDARLDTENIYNLMLSLDRLFRLGIKPEINTESILLAHDYESGEEADIGFIITNYQYDENLVDQYDSVKTRQEIVDAMTSSIIPELETALPDKSEAIKADFKGYSDVFLKNEYLKYEKGFDDKASKFKHLRSIAKKIDLENSTDGIKYKEELTEEENKCIIGKGGECIAIESDDGKSVAKIYHGGDAGALNEVAALDLAQSKGLHGTALVLAQKANIVIETKLPGKSLFKLAEEGKFDNPDFVEAFKRHLPKFFRDFAELFDSGLFPDADFSNILFDEDRGFSFPDLEVFQNGSLLKSGLRDVYEDVLSYTKHASNDKIKALTSVFEEEYEAFLEATSGDNGEEFDIGDINKKKK